VSVLYNSTRIRVFGEVLERMTEDIKIPDGYTDEDFVDMNNPNGHPDRIRARDEEKYGSDE
jgi:hypothetical protein